MHIHPQNNTKFQSQSRSNILTSQSKHVVTFLFINLCFLLGNPVSIKTFDTNTTVVEIIALVLFIIQIEFNRQYFKHSKSLLHFKVIWLTRLRNGQHLFGQEPCHEKPCLWSFKPGKTQACLQRLETLHGFDLPILKI